MLGGAVRVAVARGKHVHHDCTFDIGKHGAQAFDGVTLVMRRATVPIRAHSIQAIPVNPRRKNRDIPTVMLRRAHAKVDCVSNVRRGVRCDEMCSHIVHKDSRKTSPCLPRQCTARRLNSASVSGPLGSPLPSTRRVSSTCVLFEKYSANST